MPRAPRLVPPFWVPREADADVYTGELFSKVVFPGTLDGSKVANNPKMVVSAYIFGADQKGEETDAAANALNQAKAWADGLN